MATIHKFPNAPARAPARSAPAAPVTFTPSHHRPTLGERLVGTCRANGDAWSFYFAMFAVTLLVATVFAAYLGAVK